VDEPLVVVSPGGEGHSLVAHRASDGEPVWAAGDDRPSYGSPSLHVIDGVPQVLTLNGASFAGHDPATGNQLWSHEWPGDQPNVAQPLVLEGNRVLVSSGYGVGAGLFEVRRTGTVEESVDASASADEADEAQPAAEEEAQDEAMAPASETWTVEEIWRSPRMKAKFTNIVLHDGHLYGLDDGVLACVDPTTGERCWKRGRYGHGQVLLVGDLLLVQTEAGEVILIEPNPEEHRELGRIEALDGKSWNSPALSGPHLLVRNADEAVCYELPLEG
jgi:outer membrane protein assembly factor BamB